MMSFFSNIGFFSKTKGRPVVYPRALAEAKQVDQWSLKKSPTKEKSSSKVSVSSTAAKYHVLEGRYIFLLNYHMSNHAILNG